MKEQNQPSSPFSKDELNRAPFSDGLQFVSEYSARLEGCGRIRVRIWRDIHDGKYSHRQSHLLQTPTQATPYRTSRGDGHPDEMTALHDCLAGFHQFYAGAIAHGHKPSDNWLVPNPDF